MVARIQVTVMLNDGVSYTCLRIDTGSRLGSAPACKSCIELIDEILAYIIADPIIEYIAEETTIRHRLH